MLVALSLLVTGMLLTASTEASLSEVQREAVADLYTAEGAIHAWIAQRRHLLAPETVAAYTPPGRSLPVRIVVERLSRVVPGETSVQTNALFSVHAEPARPGGGRGAVALIRARTAPLPDLEPSIIDAALTYGGNGRLAASYPGEHLVFDGRDNPFCSVADRQANGPVLFASDGALAVAGGAQLQGAARQSGLLGATLTRAVLSGTAMRDLAWNASIRFGRFFNEPSFEPGTAVASGHDVARYDWGCPTELVNAVRAAAPGMNVPPPCALPDDSTRYATVAIDAENGTVELGGEHGQGLLIVVNGNLHLTGRFIFRGLVLVEGDLVLSGGGHNWPPSLDGAAVAARALTIDRGRTPPGLGGGGHRSIRFNRCAIRRTADVFNAMNAGHWGAPALLGRTFGWFEVVE
jgi:hypothetical protein